MHTGEASAVMAWLESLAGRLFNFTSLVASLFAALVYWLVPKSMADPDIWWHLRNAEQLLRTHRWLTQDTYSFTAAGAPWINHEWLAEIPFYLGWLAMGERGVLIVTVLAIETVMLGMFYLAYRRSGSMKATLLVSFAGALLATVSFGPRTLLFGWICLVVELIVLERFRSDGRVVWSLPALFALWINLHGSWIIGLVLLALFVLAGFFQVTKGSIDNPAWSAAQLRKLTGSLCLSTAALFLNPYGWRLVAYPFNLAFQQRLNIANVEEWQSLDFHSMRGRVFLVCLAFLFLFQLVRRRRWSLFEIALVLIGIYSAATYSRFLFLAAILVMPLLACQLAEARMRLRRNRPMMNAALLLCLTPLVAFRSPAPSPQTVDPADARYPIRAIAYLHDLVPHGNVFNEYIWGGYLAYHAPQIPVMIDSRADIFEYNGTLKDYLDAVHLQGTSAILNKYKIRYILFERNAPMISFLEQTGEWRVNYRDSTAVILERFTVLTDSL